MFYQFYLKNETESEEDQKNQGEKLSCVILQRLSSRIQSPCTDFDTVKWVQPRSLEEGIGTEQYDK